MVRAIVLLSEHRLIEITSQKKKKKKKKTVSRNYCLNVIHSYVLFGIQVCAYSYSILMFIGRALINQWGAIVDMAVALYPTHPWLPWKFTSRANWYRSPAARRKYFEWLANELRIESMEDWYRVTRDDIISHHGDALLRISQHSVYVLLSTEFPDHKWHGWMFVHTPQNFWNDINNRRDYVEWLRKKLGFDTMESLYQLTNSIIRENHGTLI